MGGELDKCAACGYECAVPSPKPPKRRAFLIFGGAAGLMAGAALAVVITVALTSGTGALPSPPAVAQVPAENAGKPAKKGLPASPAKDVYQELEDWANSLPTPDGEPKVKYVARRPSDSKRDANTPAPAVTPPPWGKSDTLIEAAPPAGPAPAPISPEQLFEKASPAVVYLTVRDKDFKPIGLGSGFFVAASGLIVTNYHVIKGAEFATARLSNGSTLFVDGVVATDPAGDLALLKVSGGGFPVLRIAKAGLPKVGATVYAIGNPRGLENTFSSGMVSGHRKIKDGVAAIQVTAPISPGSSGGPLLNAGGEVIGVTTAYITTGQNLNFAVPVSGVSALIRKQGKVRTIASAGGHQLNSDETGELDKAWEAMHKAEYSAATKALTELRKTQPDNPLVWYALGYLHLQLGNNEIAIDQYKHAIALNPEYAAAYWSMGCAYYWLKRHPEAIAAYKQAIAIEPNYARAYLWMGRAYYGLKRYPEAIEAYKKAIARDTNNAAAYWSMGCAYGQLKQYPEAIEAYKKAIAIDPNNAWTYSLIGSAYEELTRYAEAIEAFEQFLRLEPTGETADSAREDLARVRRLAGK